MASYRNYGAVERATDDEGYASPNGLTSEGFVERSKRRLYADIETRGADFILVLLFFVSGLVDGSVYNSWGSFVSMQTGNTVFVGLGFAAVIKQQGQAEKSWGWVKSLTAILFFQFGAFFFSRFHKLAASPCRRWSIMSSFAIQTIFIIVAAALVTTGIVPAALNPIKALYDAGGNEFTVASPSYAEKHVDWMVLVPLAILAFQSAGQAVGARVLGYPGLPTGVLTSLYVALWSDPNVLTAGISESRERNQRVAAVFVLIVGAVFGGLCTDGSILGVAGSLWIAAALKVMIVVGWWFWAPEPLLKRSRDEN